VAPETLGMSRRVLVLAVLVLVIGGWLVFRELPILESERERMARELRVFENVPAVVDSIRIRRYESEILVARDGERWFLVSPIEEEIPPLNATDLIDRLVTTERWRRIGRNLGGGDWDVYGLGSDSPGRVRIELIGSNGTVSSVDVGLLSPGGQNVWVRRAGSQDLEVTFKDLYDVANMTHHGLRDPRLFEIVNADLTRMTFRAEGREWRAVRGEDALWFLDSEDGPRLRRWVLDDVAFAVAGLRVDGYLRDFLEDDDWAAYGLDQPWGEVEWEGTSGRSGTVWLGNELGGGVVFGRRTGLESVFHIAPGLDRWLEVDPTTLVDRNPIGGNFLQSVKVRVEVEGGFVDVIRETPGARVETELGPLEGGDYVQVTARNLQLGLEEFQPLAEMFVPAGQNPVSLLDPFEGRMSVHWPDRVADLVIGRMAGAVWIAHGDALYQVETDMLLRVREVMKLRSEQLSAH
jgi:hypothetical protein